MGDFTANFQRPETGIHTVEGNVAGSRAASLSKKREAQQLSFEQRKLQIQLESQRGRKNIDEKFDSNAHLSVAERAFRDKTIGLVTAEEFKRAAIESAELAKKRKQGLDGIDEGGGVGQKADTELTEDEKAELERLRKKERIQEKKKRKKMMSTLSFAGADDAEDLIVTHDADDSVDKETKKDPNVDTSFLPDKEREAALEAERQRLKAEWVARQVEIKKELLEIVFSYWDGSGHRRTVTCRKGDSISAFLELVRKDLAKEFREMQNVASDALLVSSVDS